jgi:hypothetical protein
MLLGAAACSGSSGTGPGGAETIDVPAAPGSEAPNLAVGLDGRLYLSWVEPTEGGHALRFATWEEDAWSAPRTIAQGDDWFVNWADFPSMAALDDGTLAAHWLAKSGAGTYAYDVNVAFSRDGGESWSAPLVPHRDGTETEHGFVSLVPLPEGKFGALWLDGRNTAGDPPGAMTLRYAHLAPDSAVVGDAAEVDPRVCDCCATDAVRTGDGAIVAVYRDRSEGEIRDISVARFHDGAWSAPRAVHDDGWEISGCPVNGPAVASRGDLLAVAWFSAAGGEPVVRVAFSRDGGRGFEPPLRVDLGEPLGRVDVELTAEGTALVSWLERQEQGAAIFVRRIASSGARPPQLVAKTSAARSSGFPRMTLVGERVLLAWTEAGDPSHVRTAVLPL